MSGDGGAVRTSAMVVIVEDGVVVSCPHVHRLVVVHRSMYSCTAPGSPVELFQVFVKVAA